MCMLHDDIAVSWSQYIVVHIVTSSMVGGLSGLLAFCVTGIHRRLNRIIVISETQKDLVLTLYHNYNHCALDIEETNIRNTKKSRINTLSKSMCFRDWNAKNITLTHNYNQCALETEHDNIRNPSVTFTNNYNQCTLETELNNTRNIKKISH